MTNSIKQKPKQDSAVTASSSGKQARRVQVTARWRRFLRHCVIKLDESVWNQDASERLQLKGWVIHRKQEISTISITDESNALGSAALEQERPKVAQAYAGFPNADAAGFHMDIPSPGPGRYALQLHTRRGKTIQLGKLELTKKKQPRLLFMHIPKAAGSTVNDWLATHYRSSAYKIHIESQQRWKEDPDFYRSLDFVSGHIPYPNLRTKLGLDDHFLITVMREPFAQLASHLAWVRHLSDPGQERRFDAHPDFAQSLSRRLLQSDLTDPESIQTMLKQLNHAEMRLIDNCQVRYFARLGPGDLVTPKHLDEARANAAKFNLIGLAEQLEGFLTAVATAMQWSPPKTIARKNVAKAYYGLNVSEPEIRAALESLVRFDLELYAEIAEPRRDS